MAAMEPTCDPIAGGAGSDQCVGENRSTNEKESDSLNCRRRSSMRNWKRSSGWVERTTRQSLSVGRLIGQRSESRAMQGSPRY